MPDITTQVLKRAEAGGYVDSDFIIDAGGFMFLVIAEAEYPPTNKTWGAVYHIPPGGPVPSAPSWRVLPQNYNTSAPQKIDAIQVYYSGSDLRVVMATHEPGPGPREIMIEQAVIPGVFVYQPGMQRQSGGPGAFSGEGEGPHHQEEEV